MFIGTTVYPYIVEIKTARIGNKRIIIFSDKHSDLIENGRAIPAKQVAQNQRNALKLVFNQRVYQNPARCYIEVSPDMTKGLLSISLEEAQQMLKAGDYFDIFYVNFVRGQVKERFKTVDLASWHRHSNLDCALTDIFCGIEPQLSVNGWFADACARLNVVAQEVGGLYPALRDLLAQENVRTVENVRRLLITIAGKTDGRDLWQHFNRYMQAPFFDVRCVGTMNKEVHELLGQITDPQLLRDVLADEHDLVLVHAGMAHARKVQRYLEVLGYVVTSVHENNAQPDPFNPDYYGTPLTPETIQQTLAQAFA